MRVAAFFTALFLAGNAYGEDIVDGAVSPKETIDRPLVVMTKCALPLSYSLLLPYGRPALPPRNSKEYLKRLLDFNANCLQHSAELQPPMKLVAQMEPTYEKQGLVAVYDLSGLGLTAPIDRPLTLLKYENRWYLMKRKEDD